MNAPLDPVLFEELSSLIDAELPSDRRRFMLRRLSVDADLGHAWERYHLIGDCLRQRITAPADAGLRERIAAEITRQPSSKNSINRPGRVRDWVSGAAVAASLALSLSLVLIRPDVDPGAADPVVLSARSAGAESLAPSAASISEAEFEAYLIRHNNALRESGLEGFAPFVDLVTSAGTDSAIERARNGATELR